MKIPHALVVTLAMTAVLIPQPGQAAESTTPGACARDAAVANEKRLRAPNRRAVGRITLFYATGDSAGFCGRVHIKPRFARFGQVRYRLRVQPPGWTPGAFGASEPATDPHPVGNMCSCYASGTTGAYRVTFIHNFYRPDRRKFQALATATAVLP